MGWYKEPNDGTPKILHYTEGGPWFDGYRDCEYGDDWKKELINSRGRRKIFGKNGAGTKIQNLNLL